MHLFEFDGMFIAYDHDGGGDSVIFLHNIGGDRSIWSAQYDTLRRTHSVYAVDWLGFGDSRAPDTGYTIENYLRLLTDFIAMHGLRDVTLVGHCFGSALALLYARRYPANVRALALSSPLTANTLRPTLTGLAARALRRVRLDTALSAVRVPTPIADLVIREQLGPRGREMDTGEFEGLRRRWTEPGRLLPPVALARDLYRLAELDTFEPGPDFPPITTIWGQRNRILSPSAGATLNRTLRPVEAIVLPDCGHLPMIENPSIVTEIVQATAATPTRLRKRGKAS